MKSKRNLSYLLFFMLPLALLLGILLWQRMLFIRYMPKTCEESGEELSNPYIGWYSIHGYLLSDTDALALPDTAAVEKEKAGLVLVQINLKNYARQDLTDTALMQLDTLLTAWQETGSQMILRFLYDWDGKNLETEPEDTQQILRHMQQVGEIINAHKESVYLLQGAFVGNWGEMNQTKHMADGKTGELIRQLAEVTDASIFLSVRTPAQLRTVLESKEPLDVSQAFTGSLEARLGLFNDGMLGSETDTGTYGSVSAASGGYSQPWMRQDELEFQNRLCNYVPNGGEVITDNAYNDFDAARETLSAMHVSYLNQDYDTAVLNKWKTAVYTGSDKVYAGCSGYDYIGQHLGYRYVLRDSGCHWGFLSQNQASLFLTLENVGFASCYRPLEIRIHAVSETGEITELPVDSDLRLLASKESINLEASWNVRKLKHGRYQLYFQIWDNTLDREIFLANTLEHGKYGYCFASADLSKLPQ